MLRSILTVFERAFFIVAVLYAVLREPAVAAFFMAASIYFKLEKDE